MERTIRILHLEDDPADAALVRELLEAEGDGYDVRAARTREEYAAALAQGDVDLVLSDYKIPSFDGRAAMALAKEKLPGVPFILVSGTIGEEAAVESLTGGATDYVLKDRMARLVPAVRRALREREEIMERLRAEETMRKLATAVEQSPDWILVADRDGAIEYVNRAVEETSGYGRDELVGKNPRVFKSGKHDGAFYRTLWETITAGGSFRTTLVNRKKGGELFTMDQTIAPLKDDGGAVARFISTGKDITQLVALQQRLDYLSHYDPLTGLPNRVLFAELLARALHDRRGKEQIAVLIVDIDRFKVLNDTYGHETGDEILKETAGRLSRCVPWSGLARIGGAEFGLVLRGVRQVEDVMMAVEKLQRDLSPPLRAGGGIAVSVNCGIALCPQDGGVAQALITNADFALLKAKETGRNAYRFFTAKLNEDAADFARLERALAGALKEREFFFHYQPYFSAIDRRLVGMEALLRWNSAALGPVSPARFIPVLEETGMILDVGMQAFETAVRQVRDWAEKKLPAAPVAVNLSAVQFRQAGIAGELERIVRGAGIDRGLVGLEITESTFMEDVEQTRSTLRQLKESGFAISIDDFGTGYSSLAYLRRFPVDHLKIDITFIRNVTADPDDATIVSAIIGMAHNLELKTIAEGVETEEQLRLLRLFKCDVIQGFYLSKPLPPTELEKLLRQLASSQSV